MGMVYEALLLFGPLMVIVFFYSFLMDFSDRADPTLAWAKRLGLQFTVGAILLAYFTWSWSKGRCTLPMQTLGLRLKTLDEQDPDLKTVIIRALIAVPSVFLGVGFLWAIFDRDSQTLHDRLAGTRLVYVPVGKIL